MTPAFQQAFGRLIGHEGKLSMDPKDKGNWTGGRVGVGILAGTKYGISAAAYPTLIIETIPLQGAQYIYYRDYWLKMQCPHVPQSVGFQLFDAAVNHGVTAASRILQRAVGVKDDGVLGNRSFAAMTSVSENDLLMKFLAERLVYMTDADTWDAHGKGWARRIAGNLRYAAMDNFEPVIHEMLPGNPEAR